MTIRVGILAPVDENGNIKICSRWAKPFLDEGMEVEYIPAGAKNLKEIVGRIHGLLLPGGNSNIHPYFYKARMGYATYPDEGERELARDATAIELAILAFKKKHPNTWDLSRYARNGCRL